MSRPAKIPFGMLGAVGSMVLGVCVGYGLPPADLGKRLASECAKTLVQPFYLFELNAAPQRKLQDDSRTESAPPVGELQLHHQVPRQ